MYCLSKWWQCKRWELSNYLLTKIAHHYSTLLKFRLAKSTPQKKISGAHYLPCKSIVLEEQFGVGFSQSFRPDRWPYIQYHVCFGQRNRIFIHGPTVGGQNPRVMIYRAGSSLGDQWSKPIDLRNKQQELGDFLGGFISNILPSCRNLQETIHTTKGGSTGHVFFPNLRECLGFSPRPWGRYSWRAIPTGW